MELFFSLAILIMSIVIHEVAHGVMANYLGDPTARLSGRLTLNPLKHVDPMGSIFIPVFLVITHSPFLFGWAKPVPYNPYGLQRGGRYAEGLVALAGPATNILLAVFFGLVVRVLVATNGSPAVVGLASAGVLINVMLALFNCIPIPPLDGSKIIEMILPGALRVQYDNFRRVLEMNFFLGLGIVLLVVIAFGGAFTNAVIFVARLIAGV